MSLLQHLGNGGPVLFVLLFVSVFSLALVILKWMALRELRLKKDFSVKDISTDVAKRGVRTVVDDLKKNPSPLAQIAARAIEVSSLEVSQMSAKERERELELCGAEQLQRLESGMGAISIAAHLSPLLGLLGTVMGMISAFQGLASAGLRADPSVLAGGIWEALLTTAFGLIIAIPLLVVHHFFQSSIDRIVHRMERLGVSMLRHFAPRTGESEEEFVDSVLRSSLQ